MRVCAMCHECVTIDEETPLCADCAAKVEPEP